MVSGFYTSSTAVSHSTALIKQLRRTVEAVVSRIPGNTKTPQLLSNWYFVNNFLRKLCCSRPWARLKSAHQDLSPIASRFCFKLIITVLQASSNTNHNTLSSNHLKLLGVLENVQWMWQGLLFNIGLLGMWKHVLNDW
jgi:hypothetical protein